MNSVTMLTDEERRCLREIVTIGEQSLDWVDGDQLRALLQVDERALVILLTRLEKFEPLCKD